jgi:N-acetylglucosaminyl-diphospho-decaprenol L-rhamnosyltransferase
MTPEVSIVIVSFNTWQITCQCLKSIVEETEGTSYEIIVVDNASSDNSAEKIRNNFPQVIIIENTCNLGFAAGQNLGILKARGKYVLILNSDVVILDGAITRLASMLKNGPSKLAVVGPRIEQIDGTLAPSARRARLGSFMQILGVLNRHFNFKRFLPEQVMRRVAGRILGRLHDNYRAHEMREKVDYVDGMCVLVRRSVLKEVGLFDEQFFFDYEIIDLSNRIRAKGWAIEFIPDIRVIHIGKATRKTLSHILIETIRSELIYCAKYCPENVEMIRRLNMVISVIKISYFRMVSVICKRDIDIEIYRQILVLCKEFEPKDALREDRIPRIPWGTKTEAST